MKQSIDEYIVNVLTNIKDKKVIVTGASNGLGLALSRLLVFKEAYVIMAVRNLVKGTLIKEHLLEEFPNAKIDVICLDCGDFNSIDEFVHTTCEKFPDFNSIVINAGVFNPTKGLTLENGYPIVSGTNLFGPTYLVNRLIECENSHKHQIIFQGSMCKKYGHYKNFDSSFMNSFRNHFEQYNVAKLGLYNMFNYFHNTRSESYFFYWSEPGISASEIIRRYPLKFKKIAQKILNSFFAKPLESCLPAASIINNDTVPSGISVAPAGLWHIAGLPTIIKFNPRLIKAEIAEKCLESINERG